MVISSFLHCISKPLKYESGVGVPLAENRLEILASSSFLESGVAVRHSPVHNAVVVKDCLLTSRTARLCIVCGLVDCAINMAQMSNTSTFRSQSPHTSV